MIELLLVSSIKKAVDFVVGRQTTFTINSSQLPSFSYGFVQNDKYGWIVGGRKSSPVSNVRKIFKIDLETNAVTLDAEFPVDYPNGATPSSLMHGDIIYIADGFDFYSYNTITKEFFMFPKLATEFVTYSGQCTGSYNAKIYRIHNTSTNSITILEYNTVTNTHSVFHRITGRRVTLFATSIIVGDELFIFDTDLGTVSIVLNLITKAVRYQRITGLTGDFLRVCYADGKIYMFDTTVNVQNFKVTAPFDRVNCPPLKDTSYSFNGRAIFKYGLLAKGYGDGYGNTLPGSSYEVGP